MNVYDKGPGSKVGLIVAVLITSVIGLFMSGLFAKALADNSNILDPNRPVLGNETYEELAERWAHWLQIEGMSTSPAFDDTGEFCDRNQGGYVWFLAGTFGGIADRTCTVPVGKVLFFPIINAISFAPEFPDAGDPCLNLDSTVEQIRCDVNEDINVSVRPAPELTLEVILDGVPVPDLFAYRVQSGPGGFKFFLGPLFTDFGLSSGPRDPAVIDGYWIAIKPLPPGVHTLSFRAESPNPEIGTLGANYELNIVGHNRGRD